MKPAPEAMAWAAEQRFGIFTSAETIIEAYEARKRVLAKIAARNARRKKILGAACNL